MYVKRIPTLLECLPKGDEVFITVICLLVLALNFINYITTASKRLDVCRDIIIIYVFLNNRYNILCYTVFTSYIFTFNQLLLYNKSGFLKQEVALAGLCATYNAKWFGGYAGIVHTKIGTERNYYNEAVRNVLKQVPMLKDVIFTCGDYLNIKPCNAVVYCDPPYQGTTKYKDDLEYDIYWNYVREISKDNIVLCSEYNAPSDFECIWSKELTTTLDKASRSKSVEKLFKYKGR